MVNHCFSPPFGEYVSSFPSILNKSKKTCQLSGVFLNPCSSQQWNIPGDSKWPFHPLVGGHLTPEKGHLTIPKRSLWITRYLRSSFVQQSWVRFIEGDAATFKFLFVVFAESQNLCNQRVEKPIRTGWWFQIFVIFIPIWEGFPFWLIFFRWVETTNQIRIIHHHLFCWFVPSRNLLIHSLVSQRVLHPSNVCISVEDWGNDYSDYKVGVRDHGRPRPRPSRASRAAWRPRPRGGTEAKATSLPLKIICLEDDSFPEIWEKKGLFWGANLVVSGGVVIYF